MNRFVSNVLISGLAGGLVSHLATALLSRAEGRRTDAAMNSVSHMVWGDDPQDHPGDTWQNWAIGSGLHHGASVFWALFFEALYGRRAEHSTAAAIAGGASVAAAAYIIDYHVVPDRLKPGFEAHLSDKSLAVVYAGMAAGMALSARLRGLCRHEIEDRQKGDERRDAERGPDAV